jgi:hypothetical protein
MRSQAFRPVRDARASGTPPKTPLPLAHPRPEGRRSSSRAIVALSPLPTGRMRRPLNCVPPPGLACLWRNQGKRAEARELLAPSYNWFTEGFECLSRACGSACSARMISRRCLMMRRLRRAMHQVIPHGKSDPNDYANDAENHSNCRPSQIGSCVVSL